MNIVLLHDDIPPDARPDELDGMVQVREISRILADLGHEPVAMAFSLNLRAVADRLRSMRPDLVFNLVESVEGRGRLIHLAPALLDSLDILHTGAATDAMYTTSNKLLAKRILRAAGLDTPAWLGHAGPMDADCTFPGRYIVKSVWEDASIGLDDSSVINADGEQPLRAAIERRRSGLGGEAFAEHFVDGREFNLSLLQDDDGAMILPPAEILFDDYPADKPRIVGYAAKWDESSFEYEHTPRSFDVSNMNVGTMESMTLAARNCWSAFGLRGYARVDFRVERSGRPWILEINANPCLSADGGFMAASQRAGLSPSYVIERIVAATGLANLREKKCGEMTKRLMIRAG